MKSKHKQGILTVPWGRDVSGIEAGSQEMSGRGERSWGSLSLPPDADTAYPREANTTQPPRGRRPPTQREASGLDTEFTVCLDW